MPAIKCPGCGQSANQAVVNSRRVDDGSEVRRRRECKRCGTRFTTYERIDYDYTIAPKRRMTPRTTKRKGVISDGSVKVIK